MCGFWEYGMRLNVLLPGFILLLVGIASASLSEIRIANFSAGELDQWEEKSFAGNTHYELIDSERGKVLAAMADGASSALVRKVRVDLEKTPYINWSWQVQNTYRDNDERSKQGDDYPARVSVVVSGGLFFWRTRVINYVWSSHQPEGSRWPNAYTANSRMLAVRSGDKQLGQWLHERRNVRDDLRQFFGKDISRIDAIAVVVDADNTQQSAKANFGDIWFSSN